MRRGEVQNWHFINAAIFNFVNLSLDNHALNVYSFDGNTRSRMLAVGPITPNDNVLQRAWFWRRAIGPASWCRQARPVPTICVP